MLNLFLAFLILKKRRMDFTSIIIQKIPSEDYKTVSIFLYEKTYELSRYKDPSWEITLFVKTLKTYLENNEKTESEHEDLFISHCNYFKRVLKSMFTRSLDEKYALEFLNVLKKQQ